MVAQASTITTGSALPDPILLSVDIAGYSVGGQDILGSIKFDLRRGETVALTGPSGIGKTTLMRIIAGLETGHHGRIARNGVHAVVFQEPTLLRWRTLRQNLTLVAKVSDQVAQDHLAEVGLGDKAEFFPDQLSLGQQRRLALARAFAIKPDILLMDEPFVSLDPALAGEMMALFERLRATYNPATLLITHDRQEAERLASRSLRLDGRPARLV